MDQYNDDTELQMDESKYYNNLETCEIGIENCPLHEECLLLEPKRRQGICNCVRGYVRNEYRNCVLNSLKLSDVMPIVPMSGRIDAQQSVTEEPSIKNLVVSVVSKTVQLPEKEVTLAAYTVPDEKSSGDTYKYLWSLISQPGGDVNGTMSDQTKDNIKLSNLSEGLYRFKVVVSGTNFNGEAYANVTVLPEKRINKPPIVIITPEEQTVKLPTSKAILDGSSSTVSNCRLINLFF